MLGLSAGCLACAIRPEAAQSKSSFIASDADALDDDVQGCALVDRGGNDLLRGTQLHSITEVNWTTGDKNLDQYLQPALVRVGKFLGVNPAFGFLSEDDSRSDNAFGGGSRGPYSPSRVWGSVLFGTRLFKKEIKEFDSTGMTILSIVSHEYSHVFQAKHRVEDMLPKEINRRRLELHADLMAGYYIGSRKREVPNLPVYDAGELFYRIGDSNFTSEFHHGTKEERAAASKFGFEKGKAGDTNLEQIFQMSLTYVQGLRLKD